MAIESYRAAKMQVESEARSEFFPGLEIVGGIAQKVAGPAGFDLTKFEDLSLKALQNSSKENLSYLFESLVEDVKRIDTKLEAFESASHDERRALNELVSEAVVRTAGSKDQRSRDRKSTRLNSSH